MVTNPPSPPPSNAPATVDERDALPAGTRFGELEILRVIGVGGFGIVYLAQDHSLQRPVALKEYMPGSLAARGKGQMVSVRSSAYSETYAMGLRSFVNEARLLARFNHPSLVQVYHFWEANGTAYMVMPYLLGHTARDVRRGMTETPTEAWVRGVMDPILEALDLLHREGVYHRDIAPDNILLSPGEPPVLLDFGAARRIIGDHTHTFTAILKPSYAPIEQYAEVVQLRQGPWTDLYALGAVVYYLVRGTPPPPATARAVQDDVPLLRPSDNPGFSASFLEAIDWALAIRPVDRPQSIDELRDALDGRTSVPLRASPDITAPDRYVRATPADAASFPTTVNVDDDDPLLPTVTTPKVHGETDSVVDTVAYPMQPVIARASVPASRRVWLTGLGAVAVLAVGGAWMAAGNGNGTIRPVDTAVPQVAAPRPTSVPVMASTVQPARPAVPTVAASATGVAALNAVPASAAPRSKTKLIARSDVSGASAAVTNVAAEETRSGVRAPAARGDEPLPPRMRPAGAHSAAPVRATPAGPASPSEACSSRAFLAQGICMEEQCERQRFATHPQCGKVREIMERRRRRDEAGG